MREKNGKRCKIGISIDPESRLRAVNYAVPFDTELLHTILVPDMKKAEDNWHAIFKSRHIKGEWFTLTETDIRLFCSCTGQRGHGLNIEIYVDNAWYWEAGHDASPDALGTNE